MLPIGSVGSVIVGAYRSGAHPRSTFRTAFRELENRIKVFTALPLRTLDRAKLQAHLNEIGRTRLEVAG